MHRVELKTWRNGLLNEQLLVVPPEEPWNEALAQVESKLEEVKSGSSGRVAQLTIDLGTRAVPYPELVDLMDRLRYNYRLMPVAVITTNAITQDAANQLVLNTYLMLPGSAMEAAASATAENNALYVPQTVRSGQRIVHPGHVIVCGDINAGAEVIAEGDIVVFGTLRGLAHAGSQGNEAARIFAGNMRPQQVRIAGQIARAPEDSAPAAATRSPEVARIENGEIAISPV